MSPFLKLLASVSSLAIISSNFFVTKVAKAMEAEQNKDNVPIVRVSHSKQEQGQDQLSELVETLVDAQKKTPEKKTIQVAQAVQPQSPPTGPGQVNDPGLFGGDAS